MTSTQDTNERIAMKDAALQDAMAAMLADQRGWVADGGLDAEGDRVMRRPDGGRVLVVTRRWYNEHAISSIGLCTNAASYACNKAYKAGLAGSLLVVTSRLDRAALAVMAPWTSHGLEVLGSAELYDMACNAGIRSIGALQDVYHSMSRRMAA